MSGSHTIKRRRLLRGVYDAAVDAARPERILPRHLPAPPESATGKVILLAVGKAAARMTAAAEEHYLDRCGLRPDRIAGFCLTRHGHQLPTRMVPVRTAGHPVPDAAGLAGTQELISALKSAQADDLVVLLLSGGASANLVAPANGLDLEDKVAVTRALLASGRAINDMNTVRRHLSAVKGGKLLRHLPPGVALHTLAISDVADDDPAAIGSGPTVADPTTLADARNLVDPMLGILPAARASRIGTALSDPANETIKPGDPLLECSRYAIIASAALSIAAAAARLTAAGYRVEVLGTAIEGEARRIAADHAHLAVAATLNGTERVALLSGGELTVTIDRASAPARALPGSGGPNQEYVLATLAQVLHHAPQSLPAMAMLAADTDGADGGAGRPEDPAGALADREIVDRCLSLGRDIADHLARHDSTGFFADTPGALITGRTHTNVNDSRCILVDPAS